MNYKPVSALLLGLMTIFAACAAASAAPPDGPQPKTQEIPLDQIWGYEMPGTRDIQDLNVVPPGEPPGTGLLGSIHVTGSLRAERLKYKDLARPGFAVSGNGVAALRAANAVFVEGAKPAGRFSPDEEITIVFFSELVSRYRVQIRQVERKDNEIEIRYELDGNIGDRFTGQKYANLALIPLGKLPAGEYRVEMRQLPRELTPAEIKVGYKPLDEEWSREVLCKPFSFTVTEKGE